MLILDFYQSKATQTKFQTIRKNNHLSIKSYLSTKTFFTVIQSSKNMKNGENDAFLG